MSSPSVLVVDDDAAVAGLVAAVLRREGLSVDVAHDGEQALARLDVQRPALVLTDMTMPGLSGLELARAAEARGHKVPFLVMSAFLDPATERALCEEPGIGGVLRKPFDLARLVRDVHAVLDRARPAPAIEASVSWALVRWRPAAAFLPRPLGRPVARPVRRAAGGEHAAGAAAC